MLLKRIKHYSSNPEELSYLFQFKRKMKSFQPSELSLSEVSKNTSDREFSYEALKKVSRSFSIVIQQLPEELKDAICIYYLVLRGLDTIEDDMRLDEQKKINLLREFGDRINGEPFTLSNIGDTKDYIDLLENFDKVVRFYSELPEKYKSIITASTKEMADGMEKYATTEINSFDDWDQYCYYVAGLVGIGLTELFIASGEEPILSKEDNSLANQMGLFLQKTNIIRDYNEDLLEGRVFWPNDVWKKYVVDIEDFQSLSNKGVNCINELVLSALNHIPQCIEYLSKIKNSEIFRFCAIPQIMAIATLNEVFANEEVLKRNVKIRKGTTSKIFLDEVDFDQTKKYFKDYLLEIKEKAKGFPEQYKKIDAILQTFIYEKV